MPKLTAKDWLLLVVAEADGEALQPIHVQKSMFLIGKELFELVGQDFYRFVPFRYGPYSKDVDGDLKALQKSGLIHSHPFYYDADRDPALQHAATSVGSSLAEDKSKELSEEARFFVSEVVGWARSTDFTHICRAIYHRYPETSVNSVLEDKTPIPDIRMPTLKSATAMMQFCNEAIEKYG